MNPFNLNNLPLNRVTNLPKVPTKIYITEGEDFLSKERANNPYQIELYNAIQEAIRLGIINIDLVSKGVFNDDDDAITNGLIEGDVYELSQANTLDPTFYGLLKVVRTNTIIIGNALGTGVNNAVLGTGVANQVLGY